MDPTETNSSSARLLEAASEIGDRDCRERWAIVNELRRRSDADTLGVMVDFAAGDDPGRQVVAIEVLGQFGYEDGRPWLEESLPVITEATASSDPTVVEAAIISLGWLGADSSLPVVLGFIDHADPDIRLAVAHALPAVAGDRTDPAAVDALIELMTDTSAEVRDWSTFGLGVLTDADGPAVRRALWARLDDIEGATAGEAFVGLARRQDRTIVPRLLTELERADAGNLEVEAAEELADPRLLPALERLKDSGWAERDVRGSILETAIRACRG